MLKKESTEGFDKVKELERLKEEALQQVGQDSEQEEETAVIG